MQVNADVPDLQTSTVQVAPEAGSPGPAAAAPSRPGPSDCPSTDTQPDQAAAAPPACTELALALVVAQAAAPATPIASTNANCNSSSGDATTNTAAPSSASNIRGSSTPGPVPAPAPVGITGDMTAEAVRRQEACVARHLRSLGEHEAREVLEVAGAYKCERCGVRFQDVAALQAHYRAPPHHMCVHCRRDFPAREMYVEHAPTCALYRWPWYPDPVAPDAVVDLCTGLTRRVNVKKRRMEGSAFLTWPWAAAGSLKKAGPAASGSSASTSNISKSSAGQSTAAGRE